MKSRTHCEAMVEVCGWCKPNLKFGRLQTRTIAEGLFFSPSNEVYLYAFCIIKWMKGETKLKATIHRTNLWEVSCANLRNTRKVTWLCASRLPALPPTFEGKKRWMWFPHIRRHTKRWSNHQTRQTELKDTNLVICTILHVPRVLIFCLVGTNFILFQKFFRLSSRPRWRRLEKRIIGKRIAVRTWSTPRLATCMKMHKDNLVARPFSMINKEKARLDSLDPYHKRLAGYNAIDLHALISGSL